MPVTLWNLLCLYLCLLCAGCAGHGRAPGPGDSVAEADVTAGTAAAAPDTGERQRILVGPADFSRLRVLTKRGAKADRQWQVTPAEAAVWQQAIEKEFAAALLADGAFSIVGQPGQAQGVVRVTLQWIRPGATGGKGDKSNTGGGAIAATLTVLDQRTGAVVLRALETRATDDIGAFYRIDRAQPAIALICRAWGESLRRGMLALREHRRAAARATPAGGGS
ncbi:MAG: hypothetical protein KDI01_11625 [Halioglobus sp.]|nr:hypothetical protein [Halioglobus sp.]